MRLRNAIAASVLVLVGTCLAQAGVTNVSSVLVDKGAILPTRVTNDIKIDFTGNVRGQQMILALTAGTVFQRTIVGSNTPPDSDAFVDFPDAPYDTFVAMGGLTTQTSPDIIVVGGAVDITPGSSLLFNTVGLNAAWAPAPGVDLADMNAFTTARITLSNDAVGTFKYFGSTSAGTGDPLTKNGTIANGVIQFGEVLLPVVSDFTDSADILNEVIATTITATNGPNTLSALLLPTYTPMFGALPGASGLSQAPVWNPANGSFSWSTGGSTRGRYTWTVDATNTAGTSTGADRGLITIDVTQVPEPTSIALFGLALVGFVGIARRR